MKGGHLDGSTVLDLLITGEGMSMMTGPRLHSRHTHGTGCTLASAIAANLARGEGLETAAQNARDFVFEAITTAPKLGSGGKGTHGPLNHGLASIGADDEPEQSEAAAQPSTGNNPFAAALKGLKPKR
jgi:hydroxymethylpyrimidine/phosphomethylpyrimidine kinase